MLLRQFSYKLKAGWVKHKYLKCVSKIPRHEEMKEIFANTV